LHCGALDFGRKIAERLTNMTNMDFFQAEKVFNSALVALIGYATLIAKQHVGGRKNGSFEECRVLHQKDISSSILKDVTASLKLEQVQFNNW
jgi:hypothetical protein